MKKLNSNFDFNKQNRSGVLLLLSLLFLFQIGIIVYEPAVSEKKASKEQLTYLSTLQKELEHKEKVYHEKFNPNKLDQKGWMKLGFSKKQANVILKYKKSLGGKFRAKIELEKCFVISDEKFRELKPFIELSAIPTQTTFSKKRKERFYAEAKPKLKPFDPNELGQKGWIDLGFSEKQANVILKYKKSLGGKFKTKAELKKCFVISEQVFLKMEPWIHLKNKKNTESKDLNKCSVETLTSLGTAIKKAQRIINYRKALGGFYDWSQLEEIHLSPSEIEDLKNKFTLNSSTTKINVNEAELYRLKKHPYISPNFVNFLEKNRKESIKFSSFQEIKNQYNKEPLNILLEHYLLY